MQGNMIYTQVRFVIEKDWEKKSINGDGWINYNKLIQWNTMLQKKKKIQACKNFLCTDMENSPWNIKEKRARHKK